MDEKITLSSTNVAMLSKFSSCLRERDAPMRAIVADDREAHYTLVRSCCFSV